MKPIKGETLQVTPSRGRLPDERESRVHKFVIHATDGTNPTDYRGYLIVGLYPDGAVGEIFVVMDRVGGMLRGFMDGWAIQVSKRLQAGVALEAVIRDHRGSRFEPSGRTDTPAIPFCSSPLDLICRILEHRYLRGRKLDEAPGAP